MRAFVAIAILVLGVAGITSAGVADLRAGVGARGHGYSLDYLSSVNRRRRLRLQIKRHHPRLLIAAVAQSALFPLPRES